MPLRGWIRVTAEPLPSLFHAALFFNPAERRYTISWLRQTPSSFALSSSSWCRDLGVLARIFPLYASTVEGYGIFLPSFFAVLTHNSCAILASFIASSSVSPNAEQPGKSGKRRGTPPAFISQHEVPLPPFPPKASWAKIDRAHPFCLPAPSDAQRVIQAAELIWFYPAWWYSVIICGTLR